MEPLQNYPIGKYKPDYDEILRVLSEKMPPVPNINDPVMKELRELRSEINDSFNLLGLMLLVVLAAVIGGCVLSR